MIQITVDGEKIQVEKGEILVDVLLREGFKIPSLCNHKALSPYASCRLCLVEITKQGRSTLTTSCNYPVLDEIEVCTNSNSVKNAQHITMELLLARSPNSSEIKSYAKELDVEKTRFKTRTTEDTNCILCGLCVRVCQEIMNVGALGFAYRGVKRKISTAFEKFSDVCLSCGACEFLCPTNCIDIKKISGKKPKKIKSEFEVGLASRGSIYIPFPQSVPNFPVIDKERCMYYLNGHCKTCEKFCGTKAIQYDQSDEILTLNVGSIILSPGFDEFDPEIKSEYGFGRYPNVISSIEFERILSASGPFGGHVVRPFDEKEPKRIAWIQCVGSRDFHINKGYCSSVCCMYAVKEAVIAKEHSPEIEPTIFYMDMRSFGKNFDKYIERAKNEYNVRLIRSRISKINEDPKTKNLFIKYETEDGKLIDEEFNLVVLSVGLSPPKDAINLSEIFDIKLNKYNFALTNTFEPFNTSKPGIYVSGAFTEPKDIPETVAQASGVATIASCPLVNSRNEHVTVKKYPQEIDVRYKTPRIGVFICHCGSNIGGFLNVSSLTEYAKTLPNVVYAEDNLFTCSQDTQKRIKEIIKEHEINRVVIASCTPRTHEPLFQETIREAGLNPNLFEMANIRDQCSWVHMKETKKATEKARDLIKMAINKASLLKPLPTNKFNINHKGLIIGGGLAGLTSALMLAEQGFETYLIEKEKELGGNLRNISYTIYSENVQDFLKDLIQRVKDNDKIKIFTGTEIENIYGYVGNFKTIIKEKNLKKELDHGIIIVATGAQEYKPSEYLYGKDERVLTQRELEQRISTGSLRINKNQNVIMIQCVGSRDDNHPYCSRLCCSEAVKNALKIKEINEKANVYILYRDMRTYGFKEDYYQKAREKGIIFIRYKTDKKPIVRKESDKLKVIVHDIFLDEDLIIDADILALSTGIVTLEENKRLSQKLKVPLNEDGFFLEAHMKLRPVDFSTDGIYLAGLAHSPKFINESISQACASVSRACTILTKDYLELPGKVAEVLEKRCVGCGLCVELCSYKAIELVTKNVDGEEKIIAQVNEALCKGCGTCAGACYSGAIQHKGFTDSQILTMLETLVKN